MANQININRPTTRIVIISVILAILALIGHFSRVQFLTEYQFWLAMIAYVALLLGVFAWLVVAVLFATIPTINNPSAGLFFKGFLVVFGFGAPFTALVGWVIWCVAYRRVTAAEPLRPEQTPRSSVLLGATARIAPQMSLRSREARLPWP